MTSLINSISTANTKTTASATAAWPWMRDVETPIADPIEPVDEFDERLSIKDLILEHRSEIDQIRNELRKRDPLFHNAKHDDLWILRFILSHYKTKKKTKKSSENHGDRDCDEFPKETIVEAARYTLKFRQHYRLDEYDLRLHPPSATATHKRAASCRKYFACCSEEAMSFGVPDVKRGVLFILVAAGINQELLHDKFPANEWLPAFMYMNEWTFQWIDYVTRTTGRLTKSIRIVSAHGMSTENIVAKNQQRVRDAMGVMEDCYPQLLHGVFVCGSPIWVQVPWRILRPILPKRVVDKIDFINPNTHNKEERDRLLRHVSLENLPRRFGGLNEQWPVEYDLPKLPKPVQVVLKTSDTIRSDSQQTSAGKFKRWQNALSSSLLSKVQEVQAALQNFDRIRAE